jgi:hypothetical protein
MHRGRRDQLRVILGGEGGCFVQSWSCRGRLRGSIMEEKTNFHCSFCNPREKKKGMICRPWATTLRLRPFIFPTDRRSHGDGPRQSISAS